MPKQEIAVTVGRNTFYDLPKNKNTDFNSTIEIEQKDTGEKFIPEKNNSNRGVRLNFVDQIKTAGHYLVKNDNTTLAALAFNYDRKESDLRYYNSQELEDKLESLSLKNASIVKNIESNFSEIFDELQNGKQLWKWCILLALFFIACEVLISRFWK